MQDGEYMNLIRVVMVGINEKWTVKQGWKEVRE